MNLQKAQRFVIVAKEISDISFDETVQFRHVSIIIKNKSIVGVGTNLRKTHTFNELHGYREHYLHSEIAAYSNIKYQTGYFVLLNFRFNRIGELRNSRPCEYCYAFCKENFNEIWFSDLDGMHRLK